MPVRNRFFFSMYPRDFVEWYVAGPSIVFVLHVLVCTRFFFVSLFYVASGFSLISVLCEEAMFIVAAS